MNSYFEECIKESQKAFNNGDVPVGAIVVFNNKIIGRGFNNRLIAKDVTGHAEIYAIKEAACALGDWRLDNCELYVTLEPCAMCKEIIKEARISKVYYLVSKDSYKHSFNKTNFELYEEISFQQQTDDYKNILSNFFKVNCNR